jgi:protein TonB
MPIMFDAVDAVAELTVDRAPAGLAEAACSGREPVHTASGGRYGERRTLSPSAMVMVAGIHALLFGALIFLRPNTEARIEHRLKVIDVNLTPPPAPPQPMPEKPQPKQIAKIEQVAQMPPPLIQVATTAPVAMPQPKAEVFKAAAAPEAPPAPPAPPAPAAIQGGNLASKMLAGKPPAYPVECRRKREQGTVVLALTVGTDGRVVDISVRSSSGSSRLDNAARDAVRKWRWAPMLANGAPVMVKGVVEIPFVLQG